MPIITLTTDWSKDDFYTGAVKGRIYSSCPDIKITDLSHNVTEYNTSQAAFILKNAYKYFPDGSIHIIGVNAQHRNSQYLIVKADKHYFIGADNGIFGLIFRDKPEAIIKINTELQESTFPELDIFAPCACKIASGEDINNLGEKIDSYLERIPFRAALDESVITGQVIYIDTYQNVITNISKDLFERIGKDRKFRINAENNSFALDRINNFYDETEAGDILAIFNSLGLLEIAINGGKAAQLLSLSTKSSIRIKFE